MVNYTSIHLPDLEPIVENNWNNENVLKEILKVLGARKSDRARRLEAKLNARLPELKVPQYSKKQVDSKKSYAKGNTNFSGFDTIGNATQKAVGIINIELKKHYLNYKGSYLRKRCLEYEELRSSSGICNIIRAYVKFGNENKVKDISRTDSNAILDFIKSKNGTDLRKLCFGNKPKQLKKAKTERKREQPTRSKLLKTFYESQQEKPDEEQHFEENNIKSKKVKVPDILKSLSMVKKRRSLKFNDNLIGFSYEALLSTYLKGSNILTVTEPYLIKEQQQQNLYDFLMMYRQIVPRNKVCEVNLVTKRQHGSQSVQRKHEEKLNLVNKIVKERGVKLTIKFDEDLHARNIEANNHWKIKWDRGLDIFHKEEFTKDGYTKPQKKRRCKNFELDFIKWGK